MFRKYMVCVLLMALVFLISCQEQQSNKIPSQQDNMTNESVTNKKIELFLTTNWVSVEELTITNHKMIADIMAMIEESKPLPHGWEADKMSGMAKKDNKLIITGQDGIEKEITFTYDTLYEVGYIEKNGEKFEPEYSFFRYMSGLNEYTNPDTNVEKDVLELFDGYDWTIDYKINTLKEQLPENLKHRAGEYPTKIYWAYNNELSKDIGLEFTEYLGKEVVVEIYRLREQLPEFMEPRKDARGIVIKFNSKIIGAFIDAGRHHSFACSLDRKNLKDITEKEWDEWIRDYVDYEDSLEINLSKMEPEDIIREYFQALDENNIKVIRACITRRGLSRQLSTNLDNRYLFNDDKDADYNIKSAKLLDIREFKGAQNEPGVLEYKVEVEFDFKKMITSEDGIQTRFVILKKESDKSGWRIDGIGTGP